MCKSHFKSSDVIKKQNHEYPFFLFFSIQTAHFFRRVFRSCENKDKIAFLKQIKKMLLHSTHHYLCLKIDRKRNCLLLLPLPLDVWLFCTKINLFFERISCLFCIIFLWEQKIVVDYIMYFTLNKHYFLYLYKSKGIRKQIKVSQFCFFRKESSLLICFFETLFIQLNFLIR